MFLWLIILNSFSVYACDLRENLWLPFLQKFDTCTPNAKYRCAWGVNTEGEYDNEILLDYSQKYASGCMNFFTPTGSIHINVNCPDSPFSKELTIVKCANETSHSTETTVLHFKPDVASKPAVVVFAGDPCSIDWRPKVKKDMVRPSHRWMCACNGSSLTFTQFLFHSAVEGRICAFSFEFDVYNVSKGVASWGLVHLENSVDVADEIVYTFDYSKSDAWQKADKSDMVMSSS